MPGSTHIEWTDRSWNPSTGCTKVSPGCAHCYAETLTQRYAGAPGWPEKFEPWVPGNKTVVLHPDRLDVPLKWRTPARVFVNSMSDLFHEDVPDEFIDRVFAVMALTPQHTYQVLTKRPAKMHVYMSDRDVWFKVKSAAARMNLALSHTSPWPLPNVWLGVTVENQHWADARIPILLDTPAAVRFVSCEPMLGRIDLTFPGRLLPSDLEPRIDWIICGGESGPHCRPFDPDWARDLLDGCKYNRTAFFMKQMGGARPGNKLEDLPEDLRVREYPL